MPHAPLVSPERTGKTVELLAPARDAEHGIAAVGFGADAVYIGAPKFGARSAAGVSAQDIGRLAGYAHRFGAKVYVALNTVLYDSELEEARRIVRDVWNAGADALIVQDMALAAADLPPIPLHASTQTFNLTPEKAKFFAGAGFSRVVLERAAALDEIRAVHAAADIDLEVFVHGAICVCYSGQCYLSRAVSGKSGNRGECLQPCRWDYDLTDGVGHAFVREKHLLSVRDLNLSEHLEPLIDAGACSLKIEGRLKDLNYLKNTVAFYRQRLDEILTRRSDLHRPSWGKTELDFTPAPEKTFTRGFTSYYLTGERPSVATFDTPKSVGAPVGVVQQVRNDRFTLSGDTPLAAGDGIVFVDAAGRFAGTNVNRAEGNTVYPNRMDGIAPGLRIYRNLDRMFARTLENSRTRRTIGLSGTLFVRPEGLAFRVTDETGATAEEALPGPFEPARQPDRARENLLRQLSKTGDTEYRVESLAADGEPLPFVPASMLNELRRRTLEKLTANRTASRPRELRRASDPSVRWPEAMLDYRGNVTNAAAERFYREHGVTEIEKGFELQDAPEGKTVMRTRYCIRRETGMCLREKPGGHRGSLWIENEKFRLEAVFDCERCEMSLIYRGKKEKDEKH